MCSSEYMNFSEPPAVHQNALQSFLVLCSAVLRFVTEYSRVTTAGSRFQRSKPNCEAASFSFALFPDCHVFKSNGCRNTVVSGNSELQPLVNRGTETDIARSWRSASEQWHDPARLVRPEQHTGSVSGKPASGTAEDRPGFSNILRINSPQQYEGG